MTDFTVSVAEVSSAELLDKFVQKHENPDSLKREIEGVLKERKPPSKGMGLESEETVDKRKATVHCTYIYPPGTWECKGGIEIEF